MRKYYQAALTLTAVLSLIALLIYRHEYNKLRFVLQFFNSFGRPIQKSDCNCTTPKVKWHSRYAEFALPESPWQRISQDLYVYSAYNNNDDGEIRAIGFGKKINHLNYSCHVYFDDDVESVEGKFSYKIINDTNDESVKNDGTKYIGYMLICKFIKINKLIVGIKFNNIVHTSFEVAPITHVRVLNTANNKSKSGNVICVAPPTAGHISHANMMSFLAFHNYLGWKNMIVYDFGISHVLSNNLKRMADMSDTQWNFTFTTVPWNFPYAQISHSTIRKIIETDCIYRTYNKAILAVTLSWNEYINLRYHNSVENVLIDIANENDNLSVGKFQLSTLVYCLNDNNDDLLISTPVMLKSTRGLRKIIHNEPHYIFKLTNILNTNVSQQNIDDLMYINRYQQCNIDDRRETIDYGMLKFAEHIPGTKIFQYYITGQLYGH